MSELSGFTPEIPTPPKLTLEINSFRAYEKVEVTASSLSEANEQLGTRFSRQVRRHLNDLREDQTKPEYSASLEEAKHHLETLHQLADTPIFTTSDGLNHLKRYLDCLDAYAKGAGVTSTEIAALQIADQAGCQTLLSKNLGSGEIALIHTEEDSDQYEISENAAKDKRMVTLKLPGETITYCAYTNIVSFGPASGVLTRDGTSLFQAADVLGPTVHGPIWANAMAFMLLDSGSIAKANELKQQILEAPSNQKYSKFFPDGKIFLSGYVVHQVQGGRPPLTQTLEYGADQLVTLPPLTSGKRDIQYGVNYPRDSKLQQVDDYTTDTDEDNQAEKQMMINRQRRLQKIAGLVATTNEPTLWGENNALKTLHKVLQKARGDLLDGWFTRLSNDLVAQNVTVYASPEGGLHVIYRRGFSKAKHKLSLSQQKQQS